MQLKETDGNLPGKSYYPYRHYILIRVKENPLSFSAFLLPGLKQTQKALQPDGTILAATGITGVTTLIASSLLSSYYYNEWLQADTFADIKHFEQLKNQTQYLALAGLGTYVFSALWSGLNWKAYIDQENKSN